MNRILQIYSMRMMEEPLDLAKFLKEIKSGIHGYFKREEIIEFLDMMRKSIISNIHLKAQEDPKFSQGASKAILETEKFINSFKEFVNED